MPLLFEQEKKGEGRLAVWHINETENELLQLLPMEPNLAGQLQGIGHPEKRREWLASRILLHQLTGNTQALVYLSGDSPACNKSSPVSACRTPTITQQQWPASTANPGWILNIRANAPGDCSSALPTKKDRKSVV